MRGLALYQALVTCVVLTLASIYLVILIAAHIH